MDLCRYIRCKIIFYRHPYTDFVVTYERQLPFDLNKFTYPDTHPSNLLLHKHKKIIKSQATKPFGKIKTKLIIKPPKQMLSKWFFTSNFSTFPLFLLRGAACNLNYTRLAPTATNTLIEFYYLNTGFYNNSAWGQSYTETHIYKPYNGARSSYYVQYIDGKTATINMSTTHGVAYTNGYFSSQLLRAVKIKDQQSTQTWSATTPINVARYNMNKDTGKGNSIWLMSILATSYRKPSDEVLFFDNLPIWMLLYGYLQYVDTMKKGKGFLDSYILAIQSPAIEPAAQIGTQNWYMIIDKDFIEGKGPYGSYVTESTKSKWYPNVSSQLKTINTFVETGPFVPKYSEERYSNWELHYFYDFLFKWGGPQIQDPTIKDPTTLPKYDVPDTITKAIQIRDPAKQKAASLLHSWDVRRGLITQNALKRMSSNIETDTTFQPDQDIIPTQKKKNNRASTPEPTRKRRRSPELSPLALRRRYLPRNTRNNKPLPAHQQTATAAAATQVQPPEINIRYQRQTTYATTTNRNVTLTRFKPGFEEETEKELAIAFRRPPRTYKEDTPFYPWLPSPTPLVNFHLNYKF